VPAAHVYQSRNAFAYLLRMRRPCQAGIFTLTDFLEHSRPAAEPSICGYFATLLCL